VHCDKTEERSVVALVLLYFTESIALQAYYVTVVEDRPILSAEYRLPLLAKTDPSCSAVFLRQLSYLLKTHFYNAGNGESHKGDHRFNPYRMPPHV